MILLSGAASQSDIWVLPPWFFELLNPFWNASDSTKQHSRSQTWCLPRKGIAYLFLVWITTYSKGEEGMPRLSTSLTGGWPWLWLWSFLGSGLSDMHFPSEKNVCHQYIDWPVYCLCESLLLSWLCLAMISPHGPDLFMWSFTTFADYFHFHLRKRNVEARCNFSIGVSSLFSLHLSVMSVSIVALGLWSCWQ